MKSRLLKVNKIKKIIITLALVLSLPLTVVAQDALKRVDYKELDALVSSGTVTIVDVRDRQTFARGHIAGAINIPKTSKVSVYEAQLKKNDKIVLVCSGGVSSRVVGEMLIDAGFTDMTDMIWGMSAWRGGLEK